MSEPRGRTLHEARFAETVLGDAKNWDLTPCQLSDLEVLLNGAFTPFEDFMSPPSTRGLCVCLRGCAGRSR